MKKEETRPMILDEDVMKFNLYNRWNLNYIFENPFIFWGKNKLIGSCLK
jgi:hypothetical protein